LDEIMRFSQDFNWMIWCLKLKFLALFLLE
jgi:hypothetical protein